MVDDVAALTGLRLEGDFIAIENIVGGELKGYSELLTEGREDALERMKQEAEKLGADAVVCVRLATSSITQGASELMAYGTAVKVRKLD